MIQLDPKGNPKGDSKADPKREPKGDHKGDPKGNRKKFMVKKRKTIVGWGNIFYVVLMYL